MLSTKKAANPLIAALTALALLWAPLAHAQDAEPEEERLLPQWTRCMEGYACYDFEQAQELLLMEQEALMWHAELAETQQVLVIFEELTVNLELQVSSLLEALRLRDTQNEELTLQLNEEIKEKNRFRAEAETPTVWPLLVGGILAVLGAAVGIGAVVRLTAD